MIRSISIMLAFVVSLPVLGAKPARRVAFEPPRGISARSSANLLLNAKTSASGQWSDRAPGLAVNGDRRPEDHWACENLPVWHQVDLPAGANRPVWIEVNVPSNVPPGLYTGVFTARSNTSHLDFPISLQVLPVSLPDPGKWAFHLDLWQHPDAVARFHDVPLWSEAHLALLKPSMIRLSQAGQKTITTSLIHEAWGGQTYDRFGAMIEWRKKADGTLSYDYSIFDRWVSFMSEQCGFADARIHGYSMIPWSLSFRYYDEATQAYIDTRLQPGSDEYDVFWGSFLRDFKDHLKAKGWPRGKESGIHAGDVKRIHAAILDATRTLISRK